MFIAHLFFKTQIHGNEFKAFFICNKLALEFDLWHRCQDNKAWYLFVCE
jgi:hypothetical protein